MMCFIHKFVQSNYFVRLNVEASDMHRWIGESVFFHDQLIDLFMDECEDPSENGMMDRDDIYIIFDRRNVNSTSFRLCVFIYVGEYLDSDFCDQLEKIRRENFFPKTYAMTTIMTNLPQQFVMSGHCQSREIIVSKESIKSMVDQVNDPGMVKFNLFNTVGGMIVNKSIDKRAKILMRDADANEMHEIFNVYGFVVALFCQVFESTHVFSVNEWKEMHEMSPKTGERVRYCVKDWIANDGSLKTTLRYNCDAGGDAPDMRRETGGIIENAYHTFVKDFHVDLFNNSVGYVPQNSPKKLTKEIVI